MRHRTSVMVLLTAALLIQACVTASAQGPYAAPTSPYGLLGPIPESRASVSSSSTSSPIERVSVSTAGVQGSQRSQNPSLSADGRFVAFDSWAPNLVANDNSGAVDVFLHDRQSGTTVRLSQGADGSDGTGWSTLPSISADGRYVAFSSYAGNLTDDDAVGMWDILLYDAEGGALQRVTHAWGGGDVNGDSDVPRLSADGSRVAYTSDASNLVDTDTNGNYDVFVTDVASGTTQQLSVSTSGAGANTWAVNASLSSDGRFGVFESSADNLIADDANGVTDVFLRDIVSETTWLVSVNAEGVHANGTSINGAVSADGRYVAYTSYATNLAEGDTNGATDVFVYDRTSGTVAMVSVSSDGVQGDANSRGTWLSPDGRYVVFASDATNLVPGDTNGVKDVFLHDRDTAITVRLSQVGDVEGDGASSCPCAIATEGGLRIAFSSEATNLVGGDTNGYADVLVHSLTPVSVTTVSGASVVPLGASSTYTASVEPQSATTPLRYTWSPEPAAGQGTAEATYTWSAEGEVAVTVLVEGVGASIAATKDVAVVAGEVGEVGSDTDANVVFDTGSGTTTSIVVPAGAVTATTTLVYTTNDDASAPPAGYTFAGRAFSLEAYRDGVVVPDFAFEQPVTLTLEYTDAEVAGLDERTLTLHTWDGAAWVDAAATCRPASAYLREPAENRLSVALCHLSEYALFGKEPHVYLPLTVR